MNLGDRVLIKPLHKIVRDVDGNIIPETGKIVIVTPYHTRLARDKDIEIFEEKISKKEKSENRSLPVADRKKKGEPAGKKQPYAPETSEGEKE